ncbi:Putative beta-lactamase hcpD precursor [Providencia rettgeri]|uniref:SEL1-like repeat protein n=1 Tax=Providencia TaxID=586 RepID=UPI000197C03D|nr:MULTISPECIES: SEL1-like repeat protein [Providencia]EFE52796.1 Sel1 repeat protein [Providencia rettgeri DSM 1131]QXA58800.1 SEL1-like repeat protein [Providencia rettgeri]SPZ21977.1 Putative beta-lactamase hcpD precursor [Providencia rettgeri]
MLNNKITIVTVFLLLCNPVLSYSEPAIKCIPEENNFLACEALAKQGDDEALLIVGRFYETGTGVAKNLEKAKEIYQRLSDKNDANGMNRLAMLIEDQGRKDEAILLYQKAAELGSSSADYNLGILYELDNNYTKAKEMYEIAIKKHKSSSAMMSLGDLYRDGRGGEKNTKLAEKWYKESIKFGNDFAITRLGYLYGDLENYDEAIKCYEIGIANGDPAAMNSMGLLYQHGFGVQVDINKAVKLYQDASNKEGLGGLINLGLMYEEGLGVPQSYEKAINLYKRAYQLGYTDIQSRIDYLDKKMHKKSN